MEIGVSFSYQFKSNILYCSCTLLRNHAYLRKDFKNSCLHTVTGSVYVDLAIL
jgi:hypothetical protein